MSLGRFKHVFILKSLSLSWWLYFSAGQHNPEQNIHYTRQQVSFNDSSLFFLQYVTDVWTEKEKWNSP